MRNVLKTALVLLALCASLNLAFAWGLCVEDPCADGRPSTRTLELAAGDDNSVFYLHWDICRGCEMKVELKVAGSVLWSGTLRSGGEMEIPNTGADSPWVTLTVQCEEDPHGILACSPGCLGGVKVGNPRDFGCP